MSNSITEHLIDFFFCLFGEFWEGELIADFKFISEFVKAKESFIFGKKV